MALSHIYLQKSLKVKEEEAAAVKVALTEFAIQEEEEKEERKKSWIYTPPFTWGL